MLVGRKLSPAQSFASELALVLEQREKAESFTDQYRLAAVSADPVKFTPVMFPEWWSKKGQAEDPEDVLEADEGTFKFTESVTPDEVEEILRQFATNPTVTVGGADVEGWM